MREPLRDKTRLEHILEAIERLEKFAGSLQREELEADVLRYYGDLNQFHKEAMERTMKKIVEFKKSPMNSKDFADYMRRNLETAKNM